MPAEELYHTGVVVASRTGCAVTVGQTTVLIATESAADMLMSAIWELIQDIQEV